MRVRVVSPLRYNGRRYAPGDELDTDNAQQLVRLGCVEPLEAAASVPDDEGALVPAAAVETALAPDGDPAEAGSRKRRR